MGGRYFDDEPKTVRIRAGRPGAPSFVEAETQEIGRLAPPRPSEQSVPLDTGELFRTIKAMLPFFAEAELPVERREELTLERSIEAPPFLRALDREATASTGALGTSALTSPLAEGQVPVCGLLTAYHPATLRVVLYETGVDWTVATLGDELLALLPPSLDARPAPWHREGEDDGRAPLGYLRAVLVELSLLHGLAHAVVHLGAIDEAPWHPPHSFDAVEPFAQEHLAQSMVLAALRTPEVVSPFPPSDLQAIFSRLSLSLSPSERLWATRPAFRTLDGVPQTLRLLRSGGLVVV